MKQEDVPLFAKISHSLCSTSYSKTPPFLPPMPSSRHQHHQNQHHNHHHPYHHDDEMNGLSKFLTSKSSSSSLVGASDENQEPEMMTTHSGSSQSCPPTTNNTAASAVKAGLLPMEKLTLSQQYPFLSRCDNALLLPSGGGNVGADSNSHPPPPSHRTDTTAPGSKKKIFYKPLTQSRSCLQLNRNRTTNRPSISNAMKAPVVTAILNRCNESTAAAVASLTATAVVSPAATAPQDSVRLFVNNLDYNIDAWEWNSILTSQFKKISANARVSIKNSHSGGCSGGSGGGSALEGCTSLYAIVTMPSLYEARLAISQIHRKKIGHKRVQIKLLPAAEEENFFQNLSYEIIELLQSVQSEKSLPLCKFIELFEKRYRHSIAVSDLYRLKHIVEFCDNTGETLLDLMMTAAASSVQEGGGHFDYGGRFIRLVPSIRNSEETRKTFHLTDRLEEPAPMTCQQHCPERSSEFKECMNLHILPKIKISLPIFEEQVHQMLHEHQGVIPLQSFVTCYVAIFGGTAIAALKAGGSSADPSTITDGVPIEYLLTSLKHVCIVKVGGSRVRQILQWKRSHLMRKSSSPTTLLPLGNDNEISTAQQQQQQLFKRFPPLSSKDSQPQCTELSAVGKDPLHEKLTLLSREVIDLLKHQNSTCIAMSKFIPIYHHHFGKQCRVADYGYSKLPELLDALPSACLTIGLAPESRFLMLSHLAQIRRFSQDLVKILRAQPTRSCLSTDFPTLFMKTFHRPFSVTEYGVCYLEDLLKEIPESTVEIHIFPDSTNMGDFTAFQMEQSSSYKKQIFIFSLPRRVQTIAERERTVQFALEVLELLQNFPRGRILLSKFIPAYHHYYGRQCRVSDYGFIKLYELLESVPYVIQIVDEDNERYVTLTRRELLRLFASQTLLLLESVTPIRKDSSFIKALPLSDFMSRFEQHHGHELNLQDFQMNHISKLIACIPNIATLLWWENPPGNNNKEAAFLSSDNVSSTDPSSSTSSQWLVSLADRSFVRLLAHQTLMILLESPSGSLPCDEFANKFRLMFHQAEVDWRLIQQELGSICSLQIDPCPMSMNNMSTAVWRIKLHPLVMFARDYRDLLRSHQGKLFMGQFCMAYERHFGVGLMPQAYGYPTLLSLLRSVDYVAILKGRGMRAILQACVDFVGTLTYRVAYNTEPVLMPLPKIVSDDVSQVTASLGAATVMSSVGNQLSASDNNKMSFSIGGQSTMAASSSSLFGSYGLCDDACGGGGELALFSTLDDTHDAFSGGTHHLHHQLQQQPQHHIYSHGSFHYDSIMKAGNHDTAAASSSSMDELMENLCFDNAYNKSTAISTMSSYCYNNNPAPQWTTSPMFNTSSTDYFGFSTPTHHNLHQQQHQQQQQLHRAGAIGCTDTTWSSPTQVHDLTNSFLNMLSTHDDDDDDDHHNHQHNDDDTTLHKRSELNAFFLHSSAAVPTLCESNNKSCADMKAEAVTTRMAEEDNKLKLSCASLTTLPISHSNALLRPPTTDCM